ncbi:hypothetical protein CDEF62S_02980 [Castellaniella defragrans]
MQVHSPSDRKTRIFHEHTKSVPRPPRGGTRPQRAPIAAHPASSFGQDHPDAGCRRLRPGGGGSGSEHGKRRPRSDQQGQSSQSRHHFPASLRHAGQGRASGRHRREALRQGGQAVGLQIHRDRHELGWHAGSRPVRAGGSGGLGCGVDTRPGRNGALHGSLLLPARADLGRQGRPHQHRRTAGGPQGRRHQRAVLRGSAEQREGRYSAPLP